MRIVFDFTPVIESKYTGFYTYGVNLLQSMQKLPECPEFGLFYFTRFEEAAQEEISKLNDNFKLYPTKIKMRWLEKMWSLSSVPKLQHFTKDFDIYHSFYHLMPPTKKRPRVVTVYDLRRFKFPDIYKKSKTEYFVNAIKDCDHIISISDATTQDLCEIFNLPEKKITRVYLGPDTDVEEMNNERINEAKSIVNQQNNGIGCEYFVTISATDIRKNIANTIKGFIASDLSDDSRLVVVGFQPKDNKELEEVLSDPQIASRVIMLGAVEDINAFIAASKGLIFATLYEGFGIPIANAMKMNVPVITSNVSSMPEVGGDAALYVDPFSISDITSAINKLVNNKEFRDSMIKKGIEHSKLFTWENTAKQTLDVYKKLLS